MFLDEINGRNSLYINLHEPAVDMPEPRSTQCFWMLPMATSGSTVFKQILSITANKILWRHGGIYFQQSQILEWENWPKNYDMHYRKLAKQKVYEIKLAIEIDYEFSKKITYLYQFGKVIPLPFELGKNSKFETLNHLYLNYTATCLNLKLLNREILQMNI